MTAVNLTTMYSTNPSAPSNNSPPMSEPSSEAHHVQPTKILAFFSTDGGKHEPRPASFPRDPVIVRSKFQKDVQDYCTRLRTEYPKACYSIWPGHDIRWYFDEYDFHRHGGLFLYTVLTTLMEENGKRVVSFCQSFAERNKSTFPEWAERALPPDQLFHQQDHDEFGPDFLDYARQCIIDSYERARDERLLAVDRSIAAHGVPFQAQESSIAGAYTANGRAIPPAFYVHHGQPFNAPQPNLRKGSMKAKGKNGSRVNHSPPNQQGIPAVMYDTEQYGTIVAVPDGVPVPFGLRPIQLPPHHFGPPSAIVQLQGAPTDFALGFQGGMQADPRAPLRQEQDQWHGQELQRHYSRESVRGRRNSGTRGGTYKNTYGHNSIRRPSLGQGSNDTENTFNNARRFNQGEETWRRSRIFEREVQQIPPEMNNFQVMVHQNQMLSDASLPTAQSSAAAISAHTQDASEPLVRPHSGSSASTQPTAFHNLPNKSQAGNKYQPQYQADLPTMLPRGQQVDEYFVGEDREDVCDVFVGNIPKQTSEQTLRSVFEEVVAVQEVSIKRSVTGMYHCGFVKFFSTANLRKVLPPTTLTCRGQNLDVKVSRQHLTINSAKHRSPVEMKKQLAYSPAQAILLNAERQQAEQERSSKYSRQDVRSTMIDVPKVDLDMDATTGDNVVLEPRDVSKPVEAEVARREDNLQPSQKENFNPGTTPGERMSQLSEGPSEQRRKKDNAESSRLPATLIKALSSIGEAEEPPEIEQALKTTLESAEVTRVDTEEGDAPMRSELSTPHGAKEVWVETQDESELVQDPNLRSEGLVQDPHLHSDKASVYKESKESAPLPVLPIVTSTAETLKDPTMPKQPTKTSRKRDKKVPSSATQAIPKDVLSSDESIKTKTEQLQNKSSEVRQPVPEENVAATGAKLDDLTLSDKKTENKDRDARALNVTTNSVVDHAQPIISSATTVTPADSAYTEGFATPSTPSSLGHFGSQTLVKDQNAIVDLATLHKDIARAEKLHADLDDEETAGKMSKDLQACKDKLNELIEKIDAVTATKGEGKNKATVAKKFNKKVKLVKEAYEKLTEQVAFLFQYKKKEVSKETKDLKKQDEVVAKETARLLNEQATLKARAKNLSETVKNLKQENNKSSYPKADPGASSMKLVDDNKSAYPKADPGASSMKLNPTSNTFKPGSSTPVFKPSDLHFDQDPTIDDTRGRLEAANKAYAKQRDEGVIPIGQLFPSYDTFLMNDLKSTIEQFPRRAPETHRTEMDMAGDEEYVPRRWNNRAGGTHAVSGAGLGISLPGMPGYPANPPAPPDDTVSRTTSPPLTPGLQLPKTPFSYANAASKGKLSEMNAADRAKLKGKGKAPTVADEGPSTKAATTDKTTQGEAKDQDEWKAPEGEWGQEGYVPRRFRGKGKAALELGGVEMQRGG